MPELPEVETVARQLHEAMQGLRISRSRVFDKKLSLPRGALGLTGRVINKVWRSGKQVVLSLDPGRSGCGPIWLVVHLRMTGRLIWCANGTLDRVGDKPRARWDCEQGGALFFCDTRRFGTLQVCQSEEEFLPARAIVDPTTRNFTMRWFRQALSGSSQPIKIWLMRQDRLVGLGNIYASEILYDCALSPLRPAGSLNEEELRELRASTRKILRRAIQHCGVTFSDFQDSRGEMGSYQVYLRVYGRAAGTCKRCGGSILRIVQAQRGTFYCPGCQK